MSTTTSTKNPGAPDTKEEAAALLSAEVKDDGGYAHADTDTKKEAETLSTEHGGATVTHDPATDELSVDDAVSIDDVLRDAASRLTPAKRAKALERAEIDGSTPATPEQIKRGKSKAQPGLVGIARALWIITGEGSKQQADRARLQREAKDAGEKGTTRSTPTGGGRGPKAGSSISDAMTVLKGRTNPMTPQAIYDAGVAKGLFAGLTGKTPVATLAAQLAVANKKGQHVNRPVPGRYELRKGS